jgi:LPS-assembly protein
VNIFSFSEVNGEMGDASAFSNSISYNINDNNQLTFKTRRNRKINLTEYYDLVYEYKNDCLTAGVKYKKTYYADRDLKPTENLLFTITIFPITTYEYNADDFIESDFWQNK